MTIFDELKEGRYAGQQLVDVIERNPFYVRDKLEKGTFQLASCARDRLRESLAEWHEYEAFWHDRNYNVF